MNFWCFKVIVNVTPKQWALAAYLGEARRRSNENVRNPNRDRGYSKNILNDLQGAIGEIVAYEVMAHQMSDKAKDSHKRGMFGLGGGSRHSACDMHLDDHPQKLRLDVKTFDCMPNKRYFAINSRKHNKLRGSCDGYTCILIPTYGRLAEVVNGVTHSSVDEWPEKDLASCGDPSKNLPIRSFVDKYSSTTMFESVAQSPRYQRSEIEAQIKSPEVKREFLNMCPEARSLFVKV